MSIWRQKWKEYCNYTGRCLTKQRSKLLSIWDRSFLGLRANGRKIVDQQLPTLLDVTCCVRLHTPLHVVACCCAKFETSQTFQPTTPNISFVPWSPKHSATMLDPFAQLFQHWWGHARSLRMVYKDLWVVSFPRYTAGPNIVGKCCIRLHAALDIKHYVLLLLRAHIPQIIRTYNSLKNGETKTSCAE